MADECDECNNTGWVSDALTQRQRSLAKQFGWEMPDFFDRPCPSCCEAVAANTYRIVHIGAIGSSVWQVERCEGNEWSVVAWFPTSSEAVSYVRRQEARRG